MFQSFRVEFFSSTTTQAYLNCCWTCFWDFLAIDHGTPTGHWIPLKDGETYGNRIAKMGFPKIGKDWERLGTYGKHIFQTSKPMWFWIFWGSKCWHNCNCRCRWGRGAGSTWGENRSKGVKNPSFHWEIRYLGIQRKSDVFQAAEVNPIYWLVVSTCFLISGYFWSVANNFQCVDDISYLYILATCLFISCYGYANVYFLHSELPHHGQMHLYL